MLRRLLSIFLVAVFSWEAILAVDPTKNPCSAGALMFTKANKCECRRNNGAMGRFRPGCSARRSQGVCLSACIPGPEAQNSIIGEADMVCPAGTRACPVGKFEFECVSPTLDVDNCGGCVSTGQGVACGDYPGVRGAACAEGICDVYSCHYGYTLANGECVRRQKRKTIGP
ncbi:hypothetical protein C8R44DRAFT_367494 [Mycena epipterygia]|nr:hypothetical protein C8R44DRAFT_367494 [Mycena epipterygia]